MDTSTWKRINGVFQLSKSPYDFETPYIKYRKKESYLLSDAEVSELPDTFLYNMHRKEWVIRKKTLARFYTYMKKRQGSAKVLDVGCGNGWISNKLSNIEGFSVYGLDINRTELEQAARVFPKANLHFCYGDVYRPIFEDGIFDYIILSDSINYFSNLQQLVNRCRSLLKSGGEVHIIDSQIYLENQIEEAKEKTEEHLEKLACPEMMEHLHFHSKNDFSHYDYEYLYSYGFFKRLFKVKDSLYPWIKIVN